MNIKIKWNWGTGIAIFLVLFILSLIAFILFTLTIKYDLVENNYYDKDIKYQEHIDKTKRFSELAEKPTIKAQNGYVFINFPNVFKKNEIEGDIIFYRPSDKNLDFKMKLDISNDNTQVINMTNKAKGIWIVKVDWSIKDTKYYFEEEILNK
ncbi:MAG: FixH family protein [Candidatus Kapabacteria bacterium]|nr:FixH family protein [Candidatus Kapabacteria bacterium]